MPDLRNTVREAEGPFQRLLQSIPGFDGYREREIRRAADKVLRDYLVNLVDEARERLRGFISDQTRAGRFGALDELDRLAGQLTKLRDNIRLADYGYTGFFDAVKIKEAELDRMYEYDLSLRDQIGAIQKAVSELASAGEDDRAGRIETVGSGITRVQEMLRERGAVTASLVA
jgi:uncharacterized phage infection (PIP) family protein YhgE